MMSPILEVSGQSESGFSSSSTEVDNDVEAESEDRPLLSSGELRQRELDALELEEQELVAEVKRPTTEAGPDLKVNESAEYWRMVLIGLVEGDDISLLEKFISESGEPMQSLIHSTKDYLGRTLLHIAVEKRKQKIAEILLGHSFRFSASLLRDAEGGSMEGDRGFGAMSRALIFVCCQGTTETFQYAAILKCFLTELREALDVLDTYPAQLADFIEDARNHDPNAWRIVLQWAAASGQHRILEAFKSRWKSEFDVLGLEQTFEDEYAALGAKSAKDVGLKELVNRLRQKWLFQMLHAQTPEGYTALHLATLLQEAEMVKLLLNTYDSLDIPVETVWNFLDNAWMTPLHYAVLLRSEFIVKELLESLSYASHINARDWCLRTPMHMACSQSFNSHVNPGDHDWYSGTPVRMASDGTTSDSVRVVEMLLDCPMVDVNAVDCCRFTPLHWAVYSQATDVVSFMTSKAEQKRMKTRLVDIEGGTVLDYAMEYIRDVNDEVFERAVERVGLRDQENRLYKDRRVYVDATNTILIGAALIASATFGGWLQPPLGDPSIAVDDSTRRSVRMFWIFNSLSFFFAAATIMAALTTVLPVPEALYIEKAVTKTREWLVITSSLLTISVSCVMGAFGAAGFASHSQVSDLETNMIATTAIGGFVCCTVGLCFLRGLYAAHSRKLSISGRCSSSKVKIRDGRTCYRDLEYLALDATSKAVVMETTGRQLSLSSTSPIYVQDKDPWHYQHRVVQAFWKAYHELQHVNSMSDFEVAKYSRGNGHGAFTELRKPESGSREDRSYRTWDSLELQMKKEMLEYLNNLIVCKSGERGLPHLLLDLPLRHCRDLCTRRDEHLIKHGIATITRRTREQHTEPAFLRRVYGRLETARDFRTSISNFFSC